MENNGQGLLTLHDLGGIQKAPWGTSRYNRNVDCTLFLQECKNCLDFKPERQIKRILFSPENYLRNDE